MGEYGSKNPSKTKMTKILDNLCIAAYRNLEDELTRSYVLSAITKLHTSMEFCDNENVRAVMYDYL